ncbi:MAG: 3-isopropylmalate dehydratase [Halobacteriota archaeon]|nr:3-isopropylmalate dehydratase [Halobacteriota archaeon]
MKISGRVWVFPDNVDTDAITPAKYFDTPGELRNHILETFDKSFPKEVQPGDVIVAGKNFGCGSSRETAPDVFPPLKVGVIVAESFGRIFYRNSIAIGLPILECPDVGKAFEKWQEMEVDLEEATVKNLTTGKTLQGKKLPPMLLDIIKEGGQLKRLKKEFKAAAKKK